MVNNDVLRSVRFMLDINDAKMAEIAELGGLQIPVSDIKHFLKKEDEEGYLEIGDEMMAYFLDGLIFFRRGKDKNRPRPPFELPMTNNVMLKKLRVAFELKEEDMIQILASAGFEIGKAELNAFGRSKDHRNYRPCGDQVLRYFLKGLTQRLRKTA